MRAVALRGLPLVLAALVFAAPAHAALSVLDNGTIRAAVDLGRGGALTWLSRTRGEHADNLLLQSDQSYWGGPFGADGSPTWHGFQEATTVVAHSNNGRTLYVRSVWTGCECALETWVTLHGNAAVVRNRLTNYRTDTTFYPPALQELPALYTVGPYRLVTYDGNAPWTHATTHELTDFAQFPIFSPQHFELSTPEHWAALLDAGGFGVGLVEPDLVDFAGVAGNADAYPSGYLAGERPELLDANVVYSYTYTLVVGTLEQIRAYAYVHRPDPRPTYLFAHDRRHFVQVNATDNGFPIDGALRIRTEQNDPQLVGPSAEWPARSVPYLYVRGAWHVGQTRAELFWSRPNAVDRFTAARSVPFSVFPDGLFHTYRIRLARRYAYTGTIAGIRLDPVEGAEPGGWIDLTCISWKRCPVDARAERRLEANEGRVPLLDSFDTLDTSFWSVTGNSPGATAGVGNGALVVDVAAAAQPLPGQGFISAGVYSRCTLAGDFDAQVDYRLDDWPPNNSVNLNFSVGNRTIFRHNDGGEWLSTYFPPGPGGNVTDADTTGSMRLVRTGGLVRGYYLDHTDTWQVVGDATITRDPVNVSLSIYTNRSVAGARAVQVAFDNFRVTRGLIECQ
jgi:hypothetical protein